MILGIDPGKYGALVWVDDQKIARLSDMPATIDEIISLLKLHAPTTRFAVIEDVSAMTYTDSEGKKRGQGAKASFNFGFGAGVLHGALNALGIRVWSVKPGTWKIVMGLSSNKAQSLEKAKRAFPLDQEFFARKKDDGRAEAALLALFGSERLK